MTVGGLQHRFTQRTIDTRPLALERRDLNGLVLSCHSTPRAIAGPSVRVGIDLPISEMLAALDVERLSRALLNLARNAVEAMPDGGWLNVSTARTWLNPGSAGLPSNVPHGEYACPWVEDSGHGMDPDTQARLFEPYFTTKALGGGYGLGLPAVYGIVTRHRGYIRVRSAVGQGPGSICSCRPRSHRGFRRRRIDHRTACDRSTAPSAPAPDG